MHACSSIENVKHDPLRMLQQQQQQQQLPTQMMVLVPVNTASTQVKHSRYTSLPDLSDGPGEGTLIRIKVTGFVLR